MIQEAAVDMNCSNLECITAETVFTKISVPDLSLYPSITSGQFFCFEKENGERTRCNDRK